MPKDFESTLDCKRCGNWAGGVRTELIGGFKTRLCIDCECAWEVAVRDHPSRIALDEIEVESQTLFALIMHDGQERNFQAHQALARRRKTNKELFDFAEQWIAAGV